MIPVIDQARRGRVFAASAVTLAAAAATFLLLLATGQLFFLPGAAVMEATNNPLVAVLLPFVVLPLVGVVFWRRPWWARWACLGFLLHNLGLLAFLAISVHSIGGVFGY